MGGERLDVIGHALVGGGGRRGALRLLLGGALGGLVALGGRGTSTAARHRCRTVGQHCRHGRDCCGRHCAADSSGYRSCRQTACVAQDGACDVNHGNSDCCTGNCVFIVASGQAVCAAG